MCYKAIIFQYCSNYCLKCLNQKTISNPKFQMYALFEMSRTKQSASKDFDILYKNPKNTKKYFPVVSCLELEIHLISLSDF